jgi:hypothetical protein
VKLYGPVPDFNEATRDHARNTAPMLASQRCGAKIRCGGWCRAPAVRGKRRCRMHGGLPKSGAPTANRNARKHGLFTKDAIAERKRGSGLAGRSAEVAGRDEMIWLGRMSAFPSTMDLPQRRG